MDRLNLAAYLSEKEDVEAWQVVRDHYGAEYSNSAIIADLVRKKAYDIANKRTNRQVTERISEMLERLDGRVSRIEKHLGIETEEVSNVP